MICQIDKVSTMYVCFLHTKNKCIKYAKNEKITIFILHKKKTNMQFFFKIIFFKDKKQFTDLIINQIYIKTWLITSTTVSSTISTKIPTDLETGG